MSKGDSMTKTKADLEAELDETRGAVRLAEAANASMATAFEQAERDRDGAYATLQQSVEEQARLRQAIVTFEEDIAVARNTVVLMSRFIANVHQ